MSDFKPTDLDGLVLWWKAGDDGLVRDQFTGEVVGEVQVTGDGTVQIRRWGWIEETQEWVPLDQAPPGAPEYHEVLMVRPKGGGE